MITNPLQRQEADVNASFSDLKLNDLLRKQNSAQLRSPKGVWPYLRERL